MAQPVTTATSTPGLITFACCGRDWKLCRPADLEALWEAMGEEQFLPDERIPYWVELWPSSLALAAYMSEQRHKIAGVRCLDLGCGLGFLSLVASYLGALPIGLDYEQDALIYAQRNAFVNNVAQPLWLAMDWRFPALDKNSCQIIFCGDIIYEERFTEPVLTFLDWTLAPQGRVWLAEPSRSVFAGFKRRLDERGWSSLCLSKRLVEPLCIQNSRVSVNIWELTRRPA